MTTIDLLDRQPRAPIASDASALGTLRRKLAELRRTRLRPPPRLTISEWADRHRVLPRGSTAEPGQWRTERTPYLRGIMDAISDTTVSTVVWMKPAQVGATEALLNTIGFHIDGDPAPILVIQPTDRMGEAFSKDRLAPMLDECKALRGKVSAAKSRTSENTLLHKTFAGGHVTISGANAPSSLAMRPIRVVLCDEVDRYPASAGAEGDPVSLAAKRSASFWNRKLIMVSTPTLRGLSRIEAAFDESDQRRYYVPCPHCAHPQVLEWEDGDGNRRLVWETDEHGTPTTVGYACASCGAIIEEADKPMMLAAGEWHATVPEREAVGFHLNALYSPWVSWLDIAKEYVRVREHPERLRVFWNTTLGLPYDDEGEAPDPDTLDARRETYSAEVPEPVGILTAAVDVQGDRLELAVQGWGEGQETWLVAHHRIYGDPALAEVWSRLEALLTKPYAHDGGASMRIRACAIDSGFLTDAVYRFVGPRQGRGVFATKGMSGQGKPVLGKPSRVNRQGVRVWPLGVDGAKDILFARLKITDPGPGYLHFPTPGEDGADAEYMAQFGAERAVTRLRRGGAYREYVAVRKRNEAIDLFTGCLAALHALGAGVVDRLGHWRDRMALAGRHERHAEAQGQERAREPVPADAPAARPDMAKRMRQRMRGFVDQGLGSDSF